MAEFIDRIELMRQIAEFGREIPKDQVIGVIARQEAVETEGDLISREAAIKTLAAHYAKKLMDFGYESYEEADTLEKMYCDGVSDAMDIVDTLPTIDRPKGEWIPFRDDLLIRENAAEVVGEFFNRMDISLFGRTGVRLARNVLSNVPTVAPLKWIPLNKDRYEPLFKGDYLLCLDDGYITSVYFDGNDWELWADSGEPVAWMPLPKPYKGGENE